MTPEQWRADAAREAQDAQFKIAHAREHIYALRRGVQHGKVDGLSVRISFALTDLDSAYHVLESVKLELAKAVAT